MKKMKVYIALAIVVLSCMSLAPLIAGVEAEYGSECGISNVAPVIEETSFSLSNTAACMGESVEFAVDVSDGNGGADVSSVTLVLSEDETISDDDISIQLDETGTVSATTSTFGKVWTVEGETTGLKNILIAAEDSANLAADNNGVSVGTIELNPMIGFEVKDGTAEALTTVSFLESAPGTQNLPANQNAIEITNIGGTAIDVLICGTDMTCGDEIIPISNMNVDGIPMSTTPQLIAGGIEPSASSTHNIFINYPTAMPAGAYQGSVTIEIGA